MPEGCPFCDLDADRISLENEIGVVISDQFPVSQGHALVIPKAHVASIYDLPDDDQLALWHLVAQTRLRLQEEHEPDGFNVGVNDGVAAGQTVLHAHVHVIPRRDGDVEDPRGGVRWVMSNKARYW